MYEFVDLNERGVQSTSSSIQTTFNSVNLDEALTDETGSFRTLTVSGRSNIVRRLSTLEIPSLDGLIETDDNTMSAREITVKYEITDETNEGFRKRYNRLNALLEGSKKTLVFTDENASFYATLVESSVPEEDSNSLIANLIFICSDPFKYGPEQSGIFENEALTLTNNGTAESFPVIEATAKASSTSFMVAKNDEEYFMIGQPFDIDKQAIEQYPEVSRWGMESLVGWSHMTDGFLLDDEVSGGQVSGSSLEVADGTSFTPASYGTTRGGWYGPGVRTSLPEAVGDFSITLGVSASNDGNGVGKVMAILLDEFDDIVASIGLVNTRLGTKNMRVLARMNDGQNINRHRVMDYSGDTGEESTVFSGSPLNIRLRREGNKFEAYTWQVTDGVPHARHGETIIDDTPEFQRPIQQVVLYFAKHGDTPVFPMKIYGLRVHDNNSLLLDESMIPYICHAGDDIKVDTKNELVLVNDEPSTDLKAFGADYFMLDPGVNHLFTFPSGVFDTSVSWRDRIK